LSTELLSILGAIIGRKEFKNSSVAASLTGGRDSRLIAAIAAAQFPNIHYRIAISSKRSTSLRDLGVAKKIAKVSGIPLDVYPFQHGQDEKRFCTLTEGFAPSFNHSITPLINNAGAYSLGFGGVYGTELFMPIPWNSIDDYVQLSIDSAKKVLKVEDGFWKYFREALYDEFQRTKDHYHLSDSDERDYIRLFNLLDTARYSSFIISAFNRSGYQLEPYGSYAVLDLALRVAPTLWGNHRRFGGNALVQKAAMAKLDPRLGKLMTYAHMRPMVPLSITSTPLYIFGFTKQIALWLGNKIVAFNKVQMRTDFSEGYYLSNGWEKHFIKRSVKKYGDLVK